MAKAPDPPAEPVTEPAAGDGAPSNAELAQRVDGLASKLDMVLDKLGGARDQAHDAAQQHTEERLDRPSGIAEEIRAQLAARDQADAAAAKDREAADWRQSVDGKLAGMAEKTPEAPVRRIERAMGWR